MYGVTAAFLEALRYSHRAYGYLEAWRGGQRLTLDDGSPLPVADGGSHLPLLDGSVSVDGSTPGVRRTLSVSLAPVPGLWDLLAPIGTELRAFTVLRFFNGAIEVVPQGVFDVDVQRMGYGLSGSLSLTAPDRWVRVQRARFLAPRSVGGGGVTARALISSLLLEVLPAGTAVVDLATSTATVPVQMEDRDRAGLVESIAKAASLDVFMGRNGELVIRDAPVIGQSSVWDVNTGIDGVMVDASRERSRQRTYNLVVVNSSRNDGTPLFATQYVWDNDPKSPTYCGPGTGSGPVPPAASEAGPFGQRPTFYSSPLLTTASQAVTAGRTILGRVTGLAAQLSLSAVSNPALDDGDTIRVTLPQERRDIPRPVELHIADKLTVPLVPSKSTQSIDTRSTLADYAESEE